MKPVLIVTESMYRIIAESGEYDMSQFTVMQRLPETPPLEFAMPKQTHAQPYYRRFEKKRRRL